MLNGKGDAERNLNFYLIYEIKTPNSEFTSTAKDSTQREKIPYICGLRTRIECEPVSEHSTHSDRVTNIGYLLSLGASTLPAATQNYPCTLSAIYNGLIFSRSSLSRNPHVTEAHLIPALAAASTSTSESPT